MSLKMLTEDVRIDEEMLLIAERNNSIGVRIDKYCCVVSASCVQSCAGYTLRNLLVNICAVCFFSKYVLLWGMNSTKQRIAMQSPSLKESTGEKKKM